MKKIVGIAIRIIMILLVLAWVGLIIVEHSRYLNDEPMLVVLKEEVKTYEDGHVYVYYGLGYKAITYRRTSLYGKQFGHLFTKVKEEVPKRK